MVLSVLTAAELDILLTPFDLKRLESYANNSLDYHVVLDLLPTLAQLYFDRRLGPDVRLSAVQSAILLGLGLQRKSIEEIEKEVGVSVNQALALFVKLVRKIVKHLQDLRKTVIAATIPEASAAPAASKPLDQDLKDELKEVGDQATAELRETQRKMLENLDLSE